MRPNGHEITDIYTYTLDLKPFNSANKTIYEMFSSIAI